MTTKILICYGAGFCGLFGCNYVVTNKQISLSFLNISNPFTNRVAGVFARFTDCVQLPLKTLQCARQMLISWIQGDVSPEPAHASSLQRWRQKIGIPIGETLTFLMQDILAPVIEEFIYRGFPLYGQVFLERCTGMKVDPLLFHSISSVLTNVMFGFAHTSGSNAVGRMRTLEFSNAAVKGVILTIVAKTGGLKAAVIEHVVYNILQDIKVRDFCSALFRNQLRIR